MADEKTGSSGEVLVLEGLQLRGETMRRILTLTLPLLCGTLLLAQTKKSEPAQTKKSEPTTLTTSVFLITKGGDLKPARLGKVKAFYLRRQDDKGRHDRTNLCR